MSFPLRIPWYVGVAVRNTVLLAVVAAWGPVLSWPERRTCAYSSVLWGVSVGGPCGGLLEALSLLEVLEVLAVVGLAVRVWL